MGGCLVALRAAPPGVSRPGAWPDDGICEVVPAAPPLERTGRRGTVVVLPGNPGVPGYYRHFANTLAERTGCDVKVLGLCGHMLEPKLPPWRVFTLKDQIEHVLGYIDSVRGDGELLIVGHSIGGYIGLEAMRLRPGVVRSVLGLMPFLENNVHCPSFARLQTLASLPSPAFWPLLTLICAILACLRRLPLVIRRFLVAGATRGCDAESVDLTADAMLQPGVFANYAAMGRSEFRDHAAPYDFARRLGSTLIGRVRLLYTDGDMWAPEALRALACAAGVRAELREGLGHAFCTSKASSEWAAGWAARQLEELEELA